MKKLSQRSAFFVGMLFLLFLPGPQTAESGNKIAPDFTLVDLNGKPHRLSDYRGSVVILNFWASWCPDCILEMPSLNTFYEKNRNNGLAVLGITSDRKKEPVLVVLKKTPVSYPLLLDTTGGIFIKQYTVIGLPTTYVIDKSGAIVEKIIGRTDFSSASFAGKIRDLLSSGRTK